MSKNRGNKRRISGAKNSGIDDFCFQKVAYFKYKDMKKTGPFLELLNIYKEEGRFCLKYTISLSKIPSSMMGWS